MKVILTRFSLFGSEIEIFSYSFFLALGMLTAFLLSVVLAKRDGLPLKSYLACLTGSALSVPIGARIYFVLTNKSIHVKDPFLAFSLDTKGFALYGGLLLSAITALLLCRLLHINIWKFADSITPGIGIGLIISRIGCFLNGCCFGTETDMPWGVAFPVGCQAGDYHLSQSIKASGIGAIFTEPHPVHPTQLYEIAGLLISLALAVLLSRFIVKSKNVNADAGLSTVCSNSLACSNTSSSHSDIGDNRNGISKISGIMFISFMLIFTVFRWLNHYFRVPSNATSGPDWLTPLIYALVIGICGFALFVRLCPLAVIHRF